MQRSGDGPAKLSAWVCLRVAWRERERSTDSNPEGIYDRFPCRGGEILFVGRYQTHTHAHYQNWRMRGGRGDSLCPEKYVIYLKVVELERDCGVPISARFKHTDNFTQVNIHRNFTAISRTRETLPFHIAGRDTEPEFLQNWLVLSCRETVPQRLSNLIP
jgi:hypothetical protein